MDKMYQIGEIIEAQTGYQSISFHQVRFKHLYLVLNCQWLNQKDKVMELKLLDLKNKILLRTHIDFSTFKRI